MKVLLYGANGYTGRLIAEQWPRETQELILAGRSVNAIEELGKQLNKEYRVFALDDSTTIEEALTDIDLVLNAAGPFSRTAIPLVKACVLVGVHYVDITGEWNVFEEIQSYDEAAQEKGVVLLPGAGFDVVPTDIVANLLVKKVPKAESLTLAIASFGTSISHGTMSTAVSQLGEKGRVRQNHQLVEEPIGKEGRYFTFGDNKRFAMSIPWGDISTAYWSTGIPNIRVFMATPPSTYKKMKWQWLFNPLLRISWVKKRIQRYVDQNISGPTEQEREQGSARVYGEVENADGEIVTMHLQCPEPYALTVRSSIWYALDILGSEKKGGYYTPASWAEPNEVVSALDMHLIESEK